MLSSSIASHMKHLEFQNVLFYNKMWDHVQAIKINNYHYTAQVTLDSEHFTHNTLIEVRLSVVLSLHLLTVLLVSISFAYFVVILVV
jgi:hypothetical protein